VRQDFVLLDQAYLWHPFILWFYII